MSGVGNCSAYGASSADRPETRGADRAARGERTWRKEQHFAKVRFCEALETGFKTLQESPLLRKRSKAKRCVAYSRAVAHQSAERDTAKACPIGLTVRTERPCGGCPKGAEAGRSSFT